VGLDRPQVGEEIEFPAELQQPRFRTHRSGRVVPFRPADRPEEDRVAVSTGGERFLGQRRPELIDRVASHRAGLKLEGVTEDVGDGLKHPLRFGDHLRPDAVAGDQNNVRIHEGPAFRIFKRGGFSSTKRRLMYTVPDVGGKGTARWHARRFARALLGLPAGIHPGKALANIDRSCNFAEN